MPTRKSRKDPKLTLNITMKRTRKGRSEEHTSELQSPCNLVCRLLLEKKKAITFVASYPVIKLSLTRIGLHYELTRANITAFNDASNLLFTQLQLRSIAGPTALNATVH